MQHIGALQMRQDFIEIFWGVWGSEWATKTSFDSKIWFSKLTRNSLKLLFTLDFQKAIKCTLRRIISLALGHLRRSSINWNKNTLNGFTGHTRRPKIDDQTRKKKKKTKLNNNFYSGFTGTGRHSNRLEWFLRLAVVLDARTMPCSGRMFLFFGSTSIGRRCSRTNCTQH